MEIVAVISTIICVWLAAKQNILSWPVGIIGSLSYMYIFYGNGMLAQVILQAVFVIQSIYGWYYWKKTQDGNPTYSSTTVDIILTCVLVILIILSPHYLGYNKPELIKFDVATTGISLIATWYLAKKYAEAWVWWAVCNVVSIVMFFKLGMYWSVGLYGILIILNVKGLLQWQRDSKMD